MAEDSRDDGWTRVWYRRGRLVEDSDFPRIHRVTPNRPVSQDRVHHMYIPDNYPGKGLFRARYAEAVANPHRPASSSESDYNNRLYEGYDTFDDDDFLDDYDEDYPTFERERDVRGPPPARFRSAPSQWREDRYPNDPQVERSRFGSDSRPADHWVGNEDRHYARARRPWRPARSRKGRTEARWRPVRYSGHRAQSSWSGDLDRHHAPRALRCTQLPRSSVGQLDSSRRRRGRLPRRVRPPSLSRHGAWSTEDGSRPPGRRPPIPASTEGDNTSEDGGETQRDSSFGLKVRPLFKPIKALYQRKYVGDFKTPPLNISRMTTNLTHLIQPAAMTDRTRLQLADNAKNWAHTTFMILSEHYSEVIQQELLAFELLGLTDWEAPFEVAVKRAKGNLGRRLTQDTINQAKELIETRPTRDPPPARAPSPEPLADLPVDDLLPPTPGPGMVKEPQPTHLGSDPVPEPHLRLEMVRLHPRLHPTNPRVLSPRPLTPVPVRPPRSRSGAAPASEVPMDEVPALLDDEGSNPRWGVIPKERRLPMVPMRATRSLPLQTEMRDSSSSPPTPTRNSRRRGDWG